MTDLNWQKVKDLFAMAIEQPADLRRQFLKSHCGEDGALLNEVLSLIDASSESDNVIENNIIDLAAKIGASETDLVDQHFGSYRIIREIGSGGMGTVFLAERDDGEFSRQVALKIVRQSVADREIIARFISERQILANLHHPNIAVLLDGGVSERGEPFLAMEYVDGRSLIEYAETNRLTIAERLGLFLKICSAVSYAHRHLVVHRDIKPSNILVTADGEPKLLDFGLAKAFESDTSKTQTAMRAFTPAYASPEQIHGKNITTSSDIYSLGVVFYELLTGCKPLDFDKKSFDEIIQTLNNVDPIRPSSIGRARQTGPISQSLRGDLDNIALTAIRKEPERRFRTVDDLAEDIERHLKGRPISARPNTAGYLAGKFVRRNKIAVSAAALIVLSLIAGLTFSLWEADRARRERDRAEKRFQDVRKLSNSLLFEISPKLDRLPGSIEARELLVQKAVEYLDSLAAESQTDTGLRAELASGYEKIGDLQGNIDKPNLSDFAGAISSFEKARAIRQALPADSENEFRLAKSYRITSSIRNRQNDVKGALNDAEMAKSVFSDLISRSADSLDYRVSSIEAEIEHGQIFSFNNRYAEAIPLFRESDTALAKFDPSGMDIRKLLAKNYAYLGNALSWDGQQPEAEAEMSKALAISEKLGAEFPNDSEIQATLWQTYTLASSIYEDSQNELSLDLAQKALKTAETAVASDKADSQATYDLARALSRAGILLAKLDRNADALRNLQRSEKILTDLIQREPKNVIYQRDLGKLYVRFGDSSEKRHDLQDALLKFQNSAVVFEKITKADEMNMLAQRDLAQSLKSVGQLQVELKQLPEGKTTLLRAKEILDYLKEQNALGKFDTQLIEDVERSLNSL